MLATGSAFQTVQPRPKENLMLKQDDLQSEICVIRLGGVVV